MNNNFKLTIIATVASVASIVYYSIKPVNTHSNVLQLLVIHCTATPSNMPIDKNKIIKMHTLPENQGGRGWKVPGYSDIITLNGSIQNIVKYNKDTIIQACEITNGATGYNRVARHVVYAGGLDSITHQPKNTLNPKQDTALKYYCKNFIKLYPHARIIGHNQVANKACPCFNVPDKVISWGIPEENTIKGRLK